MAADLWSVVKALGKPISITGCNLSGGADQIPPLVGVKALGQPTVMYVQRAINRFRIFGIVHINALL